MTSRKTDVRQRVYSGYVVYGPRRAVIRAVLGRGESEREREKTGGSSPVLEAINAADSRAAPPPS